jgi:hypothetical protein
VTNSFPLPTRFGMLALWLAAGLGNAHLNAEPTVATETVSAAVPASGATSAETASLTANEQVPTESWVFPAKLHPWARFPVGAWREIEITTETFDEKGKLFGRSVTSQKEILKAVADDSYVLDVQATVDVSGKRIEGPWNTRVLRLSTDRPGAVFSTTRQADQQLALNVGVVNCELWEVQYTEESRNMVDRIHYSPDVYPHILQRDVIEHTDDSSIELPSLDSVTTVARAVPHSWEGRIIECASQQIVRRREKGDSQTLTLLSHEVPGGEVSNESTDFDSTGRRIRWSVLQLVSYGESPSTDFPQDPAVSSVPVTTGQK